jgi:cytochrome c
MAHLVRKIRNGGSGVWGKVMMPAHPQITEAQAREIVAYILSLADETKDNGSLPPRGAYTPPAGSDSVPTGVVVLRAAYTDRGANGLPALSAERAVVLRAPTVIVASGEVRDSVQTYKGPEVPLEVTIGNRPGAFIGFRQLDLTGISAIVFTAMAPRPQLNALGGKVEVRLDSARGPVIGESEVVQPQDSIGPPAQLRVPLRPTTGMHDVYFVFRNEQAKGEQNLFVLLTARFVSSADERPAGR